jgi:hypothetical protein
LRHACSYFNCALHTRRPFDARQPCGTEEGLEFICQLPHDHRCGASLGDNRRKVNKVETLASTACDEYEWLRERSNRSGDGIGLRCLRIIDVANPINHCDGLKSMWDSSERAHRATDRVWRYTRNERHAHRGKHVAHAVLSGKCDFADWHDASARPCRSGAAAKSWSTQNARGNDPTINDADSTRDWAAQSIPHSLNASDSRIRGDHRIVEIDHHHPVIRNAVSKETLDAAVGTNGAMPIKVIHGYVRKHANING